MGNPKPQKDDLLILSTEYLAGALVGSVVVQMVFDTTEENWDPFGEHNWAQRDFDEENNLKGDWYAIVFDPNPDFGGDTWSVASYEVERVISKEDAQSGHH